ncbi:hypothetical protein KQ945_04480 [Bacillus subtilis subsp. subtilis]|nr:hypothetical protein [Bacillus subtilis subsp. subtilis]
MGRKIAGASVCIAAIAGVALLAFSPTGCTCVSAVDQLSFTSGASAPGALLSASGLEAGLNRTLHGTPATALSDPLSGDNCRQAAPDRVVCRVPVQTSPMLEHGFNVTYHTAEGRIRRVSVARAVWLRD